MDKCYPPFEQLELGFHSFIKHHDSPVRFVSPTNKQYLYGSCKGATPPPPPLKSLEIIITVLDKNS